MSKITNFIFKLDGWKKLIQIVIYALILGAVLGTITHGVRSCRSNGTIETVEAKYFMNETITVHDTFDVKVYYAKTVDTISYLKEKNDSFKTNVSGNYIEVNLDITQRGDSNKKSHKLDTNDFKLRNHSGVYLQLNKIMGLFDINAMDVHIDTDENGFVRSKADFKNKNAIKDFSWVGKELQSGETVNITLFFEMKEGWKVEQDLMLLEVDLYVGGTGIKQGEDIVLLNCVKSDKEE